MAVTLPPERREHRTIHSKRVWAGTALRFNKYSEGETQALVRWKSADSLRIYARMDELWQARARDGMRHAQFTVCNATSLPRMDLVRYSAGNQMILPKFAAAVGDDVWFARSRASTSTSMTTQRVFSLRRVVAPMLQ